MNAVKNWSIGAKMNVAIGALMLIFFGFSFFTITQIARVNDKASEVSGQWLPVVKQAGALQLSLAEQRLFSWRHFTADSAAGVQDAEDKMAGERAHFERLRNEYRKLLRSADDRADYVRFNQAFAVLEARTAEWLALSRKGQQAEAMAHFKTSTRKAYDATRDRLSVLVDRNTVGAVEAGKQGAAIYSWSMVLTVALLVAVVAIAFATTLYLRFKVARPIGAMAKAMSTLAAGDLSVAVPVIDRKDEVGLLADAMHRFKQVAIEQKRLAQDTTEQVVTELGAGLSALAQGDLTYRVSDQVRGDYARLRDDFNSAADQLCETMAAIGLRVESARVAASDIEMASTDLANRTSHQAASLEETVVSIGELTDSARVAAVQVREVAAGASSATEAAELGMSVSDESITAMQAIAHGSAKIGEIASLIDTIAFQTNLLALNAGVEAARAGDAGKGFAVVATEVRALAQRSADAAKDVKEIISTASAQVDAGVSLVQRSGAALSTILAETSKVSSLAKQISAMVERQSSSVAEISSAVDSMNLGTQQNAAMVEQTNATCVNLAREATALEEAVNQFHIDDTKSCVLKSESKSFSTLRRPNVSTVAQMRPATQRVLAPEIDNDDWSEF
ncbi:MAG: MCP four helix bundle domain-containing protein [Sphingomonas sp.]|nr:MCP four helix bundle domain-containing protein [Sphingomonas sp.]